MKRTGGKVSTRSVTGDDIAIAQLCEKWNIREHEGLFAVDVAKTYPALMEEYTKLVPGPRMDLETMAIKAKNGVYRTNEIDVDPKTGETHAFTLLKNDLNLMVNNCIRFNGADHLFGQRAKELLQIALRDIHSLSVRARQAHSGEVVSTIDTSFEPSASVSTQPLASTTRPRVPITRPKSTATKRGRASTPEPVERIDANLTPKLSSDPRSNADIHVPPRLAQILLRDFSQKHKLRLSLPAAVPVKILLASFEKALRDRLVPLGPQADSEARKKHFNTVMSVVAHQYSVAVRMLGTVFNAAMPAFLLYSLERADMIQYVFDHEVPLIVAPEVSVGGSPKLDIVDWLSVGGPIHLLRLLVHMPKILSHIESISEVPLSFSSTDAATPSTRSELLSAALRPVLDDLMCFIDANGATLGLWGETGCE